MIYAIRHQTNYAYRTTVDLSFHLLRLTPRNLPHQHVIETDIAAMPIVPDWSDGTDYFGNSVRFLSIGQPHESFVVTMTAKVEVRPRPPIDFANSPAWETVRAGLAASGFPDEIEAAEFVHESPLVPVGDETTGYAADSFLPGRPLLEAAFDLTHRIYRDFAYDPAATTVTTPLSEVLKRQRGVCQDFAHTQIAALRSMGLAARYVSGYIRTYGRRDEPRLIGIDGSHAWISVFCPGIGWIDFDPTNDLVVGEDHIVLAWGRDYDDVSPIRGVILGGGEHVPAVGVDVMPLD